MPGCNIKIILISIHWYFCFIVCAVASDCNRVITCFYLQQCPFIMKTGIRIKPLFLSTGCPVVPSHRKPIKWSYENQTLKQTPDLNYRSLAAGRILEVHILSSSFEGRFACQTHTNNQMISAWIHFLSQGQCLCIQVCRT